MQYLPLLTQAGLSIQVQSLFDDTYLQMLYSKKSRNPFQIITLYLKRLVKLLMIRQVDVIWLEYELFPYLPAWFERWLRARGMALVVDYDDAVFHNYDLSNNRWLQMLLADKIDNVMSCATTVVAGNGYLSERAIKAGATDVRWMPTVIDLTRYPSKHLSNHAAPLTIGWIGSPATQAYLQNIAPVLSEVLPRYNARLLLIGASVEILSCFTGLDVELCAWSEQTEVSNIHRFDIGIMPLPDGPWERGKCGYKLVQYMACGIPVIASAVGANVDIVSDANSGLLVNTPDDWADALQQMLADQTARQRFGEAGRLAVEQQYSVQAQLPVLIEILSSVNRNSAA